MYKMKSIIKHDNLANYRKLFFTVTSVFISLLITFPCFAFTQPTFSGGATTTFQSSNDTRIKSELTVSVDLILNWKIGNGELYTYIEANSSPKNQGVSSILPEANADAGSSLDKDRSGRVQISEFAYRLFMKNSQTLTLGLLDVTAYFDQSRIASDENSQFLGVSFVQNPTIEFPDYTLGIVYENYLSQQTILRAALTSSNGIADNPNVSYSQLVDITDKDKGAFTILSLSNKTEKWLFRGGIWSHTEAHGSLDENRLNEKNYGAYFLSGYREGKHGINLRLGQSNENVSLAHRFFGLSYQYNKTPFVFGAGAAKIFFSDNVPSGTWANTYHFETYLRYQINHRLYITADIQQLINSNLDSSNTLRDHHQNLLGLRLTYLIE